MELDLNLRVRIDELEKHLAAQVKCRHNDQQSPTLFPGEASKVASVDSSSGVKTY